MNVFESTTIVSVPFRSAGFRNENGKGDKSLVGACCDEGHHAKPGKDGSSVAKKAKAGRPRGMRSMGRFPFMAQVNDYLESVGNTFAESTMKEIARRYRLMNEDLQELLNCGKIGTMNPAKMTEKDVLSYIGKLRARGVKESGLAHNLDSLNSLLKFAGNLAVEKAKTRYPQTFPKRRKDRLPPLSEDERARLINAADAVDARDWRRMVAYAMMVACVCTGLRPKELRQCKISDLDQKKWTLHAEHVKGEGSYGQPRKAPMHTDGCRFMQRYLKARLEAIRKHGPTNEALFPALGDPGDGYYSLNGVTMLRELVKAETGLRFDMRMLRRTYGQTCIDEGIGVESVSIFLGHATTVTTESYYARKREDAAIAEAEKVWAKQREAPARSTIVDARQPQSNEPRPPLIEKKRWDAGYA